MAGKIIDEDVLKLTVQNLTQLIADHVFEEEEYTDSEVDNMFDGTTEEISYYSSLINDNLVSENRLYSSKKIADEIAKAIIDSNAYADGLLTNLSSIELKYVDSLPSVGNSNTIYILKSTTSDPDTLNLYNDGAWISIGQFTISLDEYVKTQDMNTALDTKANKTEVLAIDKIQTTTGSETHDNVYSAKLTKTELDGKVDKTSILTAKDNSATNDQVYSAKTINTELDKKANKSYVDNNFATMDKAGIKAITNPPDKDLNNYKTNGRYTVGTWTDYSNAPFANYNGTFIVLETGAYLTQIAIHRYDGIKTRLFADGAWTSWV